MGYAKDRLFQQEEQGWDFSDGTHICWRCLTDPYLRRFVKDRVEGYECSFCRLTTRKNPSTVPFDVVMELIANAVQTHFNNAASETIGWDPEDQTYVGDTFTSSEIIRYEIPCPADRENVLEQIIDCLPDNDWCQRNFASLTREHEYTYGWEEFCKTVKNERRYLFQQIEPGEYNEGIPVREMLDELGMVVLKHGYLRSLPMGTSFHRIRIHKSAERYTSAPELGPPPIANTMANRMSPAGISLFYAGLKDRVARAETFTRGNNQCGTLSEWRATRDLLVIDFAHEPEIPNFYAAGDSWDRDELLFLLAFVYDITKPVELDGREHTEYVPTQIVTEYFRHVFRPDKGQSAVDGILYPSARCKNGTCAALFFDHNAVTEQLPFQRYNAPVVLVPESVRVVRSRARKP